LNDEIYPMRKKFTSYKAYADATMKDIFSPEELAKAQKLTATETRSMCFINEGGRLKAMPLPTQAQFSMVSQIITKDVNGDGNTDLLLFGNHSDNRLKLGSIDANYGCLLTGDGKGNFTYVPQPTAGLCVMGDVKSTGEITVGNKKYIIIGVNNEGLQFYSEP